MEEDFTRISDQIKQSEYEIRWQQEAGAYMAPNRAHNLRFSFHDDGVTVTPRKTTETPSWLASVSLVSYGRVGFPSHTIEASSWSITQNTAEVQSSGLNIGYRNDKDGLRQDFLIQEKPAGKGMLRLDFLTEHRGVTMNVDATENIVFFANAKEEKVMRYSG